MIGLCIKINGKLTSLTLNLLILNVLIILIISFGQVIELLYFIYSVNKNLNTQN